MDNDMKSASGCVHFMKLYLSLIDELKIRGLEPKEAAELALSYVNNWFMYFANTEIPMVEMGFTPDMEEE